MRPHLDLKANSGHQVEVRSSQWDLIQCDRCPYKKGKLGQDGGDASISQGKPKIAANHRKPGRGSLQCISKTFFWLQVTKLTQATRNRRDFISHLLRWLFEAQDSEPGTSLSTSPYSQQPSALGRTKDRPCVAVGHSVSTPNSHTHGPWTVQSMNMNKYLSEKGVLWSRADNLQSDGCYSNDDRVIILTHAEHGLQTLKRDHQSGFIVFQFIRANVPKMHSDSGQKRHRWLC